MSCIQTLSFFFSLPCFAPPSLLPLLVFSLSPPSFANLFPCSFFLHSFPPFLFSLPLFSLPLLLPLFPSIFPKPKLFDIVRRYDTLQNVIQSVTRNLKSIVLTFVLALILIYLYSIIGYVLFPNDFMMPTNPMVHEGMLDFAQKSCLDRKCNRHYSLVPRPLVHAH